MSFLLVAFSLAVKSVLLPGGTWISFELTVWFDAHITITVISIFIFRVRVNFLVARITSTSMKIIFITGTDSLIKSRKMKENLEGFYDNSMKRIVLEGFLILLGFGVFSSRRR